MLKKCLLIPLLLISLSACMTPPADLNLDLTRSTEQARYVVAVHALTEQIRINQMHAWEVQLNTASGDPVLGAQIAVGGGMPQHGHGFPTSPRVTRELGDGRYLLEGVKFSMPGWWEIKLEIQSAQGGADRITFNTVIALRPK